MVTVPRAMTRAPLRTVRPADLEGIYAHPRQQLARLVRGGVARRIARGFFTAIPDTAESDWQPTVEAAAMGVATALYGVRVPVAMGVTAARLHHAIPRAIGAAVVAVPRQHRPVLLAVGATVRFVKRDVDRLDAVQMRVPDLGHVLVTTVEQTALDLARKIDPTLGLAETVSAVHTLWPRCDRATLETIAAEQRLRATLARIDQWVADEW